MNYYVHQGHVELGGELFGPYVSPKEAGAVIARLAVSAYRVDRHNVGARSYTIIEAADDKDAANLIAQG